MVRSLRMAAAAVTLAALGGCVVAPAEPPPAYAYGPGYYAPGYYAPGYYYAPAYPPVSVGLGFGFGFGGHHWR